MNTAQKVIAISGVKNSGKTTLIQRLIPALADRGISVATMKHDGHRFEPDRPGTDSFRHLAAGAVGTAVFDGEKFQLVKYQPVTEDDLIACFPEADLILLEGFKDTPWPKLEIVRKSNSDAPMCPPETLLAIVTDLEAVPATVPVFHPDDIDGIASFLENLIRV